MNTLDALLVVGARPQFIKAAVLSKAAAEHNRCNPSVSINHRIVHTGQHYDANMSQVFFDELHIQPPAVNLQVGSGSHGEVTAAMLIGLEREILAHSPGVVIVFGDANSTLAGALAAAKLHVPVAHVEAGLRSFNRKMPEEINRVVTDHVSRHLFCSSERAQTQLADEGITRGVHIVGDIMCDAFRQHRAEAVPPNVAGPFALASIHRADNTDVPGRLCGILTAMGRSPVPVVLPLHPRTRKTIEREKIAVNSRITIIEPLSYLSMIGHLAACVFVITDSGGLQKEAYFSGRKCVTVREQTEWAELVECGANRVVGADPEAIGAAYAWAVTPFDSPSGIYGDGAAAERIVQQLTGS